VTEETPGGAGGSSPVQMKRLQNG